MTIRPMTIDDYDAAYALWASALTALRPDSDSRAGIAAFLRRNPGLSVVAVDDDGALTGTILCGHDGRRGHFYHVAVAEQCRGQGLGRAMAEACLANLRADGIYKCSLVSFTHNEGGNAFWDAMGFGAREDLVYRNRTIEKQEGTP